VKKLKLFKYNEVDQNPSLNEDLKEIENFLDKIELFYIMWNGSLGEKK
jgi:hypothetical protein